MIMITTENLFILTTKLDIEVGFENLRKIHPDLLGMADASRRKIVLDKSLDKSPRQLKCVLSEEIGHILHPPRPGHIRYHSKQYIDTDHIDRSMIKHIVAQDERKALQWATSFIIPNVEFWRAIDEGINTIYSLVDWFDVEKWFMLLKIGFIKRQAREYGHRLKYKDFLRR
jgi:hypothetical protein